jgi:hypothetical protein
VSDDGLRELERRFRATGEPADEARWLAESLRAGRLARERLELAAFLGHPAAALALGTAAVADQGAVQRWLAAFDDAARVAVVRAAVAGLRASFADVPSPRADLAQALVLLEAWCLSGSAQGAATIVGYEPQVARRRELLETSGQLDAAAFARRAQDASRAVGTLTGLSFGDDPLEACLRDLGGAGARAASLVAWALAGRERDE